MKAWNGGNGYSYDNDGLGKAANHPVQSINWHDMVKWCNARSEMEGRLPAYYADAAMTQVYKSGQLSPYVNWNAGFPAMKSIVQLIQSGGLFQALVSRCGRAEIHTASEPRAPFAHSASNSAGSA